jgi:DNA repair ATPase RecN
VARLAQRLVGANKKADEANIPAAALELEPATEDGDDSPGLVDQLAATEETLPRWSETLEAISEEITQIGSIVQEAADEIESSDKQGKGFAARLTIARRLSQRMREPSEKVWSFGNDFASQLHQVDAGLRAMIELAPNEVDENPEARSDICDFLNRLRRCRLQRTKDSMLFRAWSMRSRQ